VFVTRFKWFTGKCIVLLFPLISHLQCRRGPLMSKADKAQAAAAANVICYLFGNILISPLMHIYYMSGPLKVPGRNFKRRFGVGRRQSCRNKSTGFRRRWKHWWRFCVFDRRFQTFTHCWICNICLKARPQELPSSKRLQATCRCRRGTKLLPSVRARLWIQGA
jgi:hypothetical protein